MSHTAPPRQITRPWWRRALDQVLRWRTLAWLIAAALVVWVLSEVPWDEVLALLSSLALLQIAALVAVNAAFVLVLGARPWLLLRADGQHVPLRSMAGYYVAGFAFSFFTPGPQLSGAPLQVYLLQRDYPVDLPAATAAITVSKLLEGLVNVGFLLFSLFAIVNLGFFPQAAAPAIAGMAIFLLTLIFGYLLFTWNGRQPVSWLLERLPDRWFSRPSLQGFLSMLTEAESQIGTFFKRHPLALAGGIVLSILATALIIFQAWLALVFMGVQLTLLEIVSVLVTVQIAVLFPTPAGLGALEAAMVFVFQRLGYSSGVGAAFALLLRVRDIGLGSVGLLAGGWSFVRGEEQIETRTGDKSTDDSSDQG